MGREPWVVAVTRRDSYLGVHVGHIDLYVGSARMADHETTGSRQSSLIASAWEKYKSWPAPLLLGSLAGYLFATDQPPSTSVWDALQFGVMMTAAGGVALLMVELILAGIRRIGDRL